MHAEYAAMDRYLTPYIREDLDKKIILLTGPRQVGKTTLAGMLAEQLDYFNYDHPGDRLSIMERSWDRSKELIVFDELHKLPHWKAWLKGIYDTEGIPPSIVVTGSAKLDTYRRVGDSLAGRFFAFRLHPIDLKECAANGVVELNQMFESLIMVGGFPEPFLNGTRRFYRRWQRSHLDIIIKQDLLDLENVQQINQIETLIELLRYRVGSPISYSSLARDLQCTDKTIKRWLQILENMYVIFRVEPHHRNIARALNKMGKYYFFDTGQVIGDKGARLENLVACSLLKEVHFQQDCLGGDVQLSYVRDKDGREIDFCIIEDGVPVLLIEVKWEGAAVSGHARTLASRFKEAQLVQVAAVLEREKTFPDGTQIRRAAPWLASLNLCC
jgi:predicted AAA+ superfamily ATPase